MLRLTQAATIGGVVVAVFGYFYTVRPIYQKALLDEMIAKQKIELAILTTANEESYEKLKWFRISAFNDQSGPACTFAMFPPPSLRKLNDPPRKVETVLESFLKVDTPKCIREKLEAHLPTMKEFRKNDLAAFKSAVLRISADFERKRHEVAKKIADVPLRATTAPSFLVAADFDEALFRTLGISESRIVENSTARRIEATQESYISEYQNEYLKALKTLFALANPPK